jgi:signal transduction histidine kinase
MFSIAEIFNNQQFREKLQGYLSRFLIHLPCRSKSNLYLKVTVMLSSKIFSIPVLFFGLPALVANAGGQNQFNANDESGIWWFLPIALIGAVFIIIVIIRNSKLKKQKSMLEAELEARKEEVARLEAKKDKLFLIVMNDLVKHFNIILGYTELLVSTYDPEYLSEQEEIMTDIRNAGEDAYPLIQKLHDWSELERGTIDFYAEETSSSVIVARSIEEQSYYSREKKVRILNKAEEKDLPVYGDSELLIQALSALLNNAIKYSYPDSEVEIDAFDRNDGFITFKVKDHGIGIETEKLKNLFNLDEDVMLNGTMGERGAGLGLVLGMEIIKRNKGAMWVESEPEEGAAFYFNVPKLILN